MGMYDNVVCECRLPNEPKDRNREPGEFLFQTKDFACNLGTLIIAADEQLYIRRFCADGKEKPRVPLQLTVAFKFYDYGRHEAWMHNGVDCDTSRMAIYAVSFVQGKLATILYCGPDAHETACAVEQTAAALPQMNPVTRIIKHKTQEKMIDLMEGCDSWEIKIGEFGSCALIDVLPRLVPEGRTADVAIVRAARTSTGQGLKTPREDRALVRYMYSHNHSSPLEQTVFTFHMVLPIFVARQLIRHRTARTNECSLRYSEAKDRFWFPKAEEIRKQGTANKQGGDEPLDLADAREFVASLAEQSDASLGVYRDGLAAGVSRELARTVLPVNIMTEWVWQMDLSNLLKTLSLRQDHHAQAEIRVYADAIYELVKPLVPDAIGAYDDYNPNRDGMLLSAMELSLVREADHAARSLRASALLATGRMTKREVDEASQKLIAMGLITAELKPAGD